MKIKKSVLLDALKVLGKVVSQTSPVEVQRSVRFLGVGEQVWLAATDGVESVTVEEPGEAGDMEDFAVEYKDVAGTNPFFSWRRGRGDRRTDRLAGGGGCAG
ncbi:MAG: hypothetical protein V8T86_03930 [Victivallis sp.]